MSSAAQSVRIGLQLPEAERVVRWPEMLEIAREAESSGFDSLWVGDHLLYRAPGKPPRAPWEAWSLLAALAATTTTVEIGPLVASTSFHNPAMLAKKASTVDEISAGRLILGLGAGWNETEYRAFGYPFDHRVSRFEEAFTIVRTLLAEGEMSFSGRYYQVDECLLLPESRRPGGPPLLIGSIGERMLNITLPYVSGWNAWYDDFANDPSRFRELNDAITRRCEGLGRNPADVSRTAAVLVATSTAVGRPTLYTSGAPATPIRGETERIAEALLGFVEAGADHLQIVLDPITVDGVREIAPAIARAKSG